MFFNAELITLGYLHKIKIRVNGKEILFEPDEERKYRAIVSNELISKLTDEDKSMIQAINERLDTINA